MPFESRFESGSSNSKIEEFELYDLVEDPNENNNIISQNIELAKSFKKEMDNQLSPSVVTKLEDIISIAGKMQLLH